ncbi:hypothetical protein F2Q69_00045833 [Brassica cretica]|uniref:Uncharacterized protein n=1 Tax=Brassica cretica TaxID=69181 RepID=A0A8S9NGY4_BRACR|nr:hypothetical protein F2Q69_00045833 [Brassica cretica]
MADICCVKEIQEEDVDKIRLPTRPDQLILAPRSRRSNGQQRRWVQDSNIFRSQDSSGEVYVMPTSS